MTGGDDEIKTEREQPVYHYNREKRLQKAPDSVQRAWKDGYTPNKGFIRGLTANTGLKSVLLVIVILTITIVFLTMFGSGEDTGSSHGLKFNLRAFLHSETVYVTLTCTPDRLLDGPVPLIVTFNALDKNGESILHHVSESVSTGQELKLRATFQDYEIYRINTTIDFKDKVKDEDEVKDIKNTVLLTVSVDRN